MITAPTSGSRGLPRATLELPAPAGRTKLQTRVCLDAAACRGHQRPDARAVERRQVGLFRVVRRLSPAIPRLVALTRSPAWHKAAPTSSHEWIVILVFDIARSLATASARADVRLTMRISETPISVSAPTTARAAPPAPSMTAGPAVGSQLGTPSPRFARNPKASVLRPSRLPSGPTTIVFTAPIRRARGSM
jgi:hypothetical protein